MSLDNNHSEVSDKAGNEYIKKALMSTLDEYPHFALNQQALISLDIVPKLKPDGLPDSYASMSSRSSTTVYAVLNKCRTLSGQRLLSLWLQHPLMSKEHIDRRLDIVKYFRDNHGLRSLCYDEYLRKVPDLLRIACRIAKEKCSITDLVKIYDTCKSASSLSKSYRQFVGTSEEPCESIAKLFAWMETSCANLDDFMRLLEESLILDKKDENNDYMLKPKFNDDIAKITDELDTLINKAKRELKNVADDVNLEANKSIKLEIDTEKGFGIRVTKQNEQAVRGNPNYSQSTLVKKDGYRFTSKVLRKLSDGYVEAKAEYNSIAKGVYQEIISKAVMYDEQVLELCMSFTVLDVFVAFSVAAAEGNYNCPLILNSDAGKIELEKLRHPCVENQPDIGDYVPNDICFNKDDKKFYIVTGPNMGGKSTYIKSIAVAVLMAQCGSMVPAEDGKVSIIDGVYTRVGAGDCQAEGISTFMEEMMGMKCILDQATENSLVIIDELGRGTSTFDGYGLAWAISRHLAVEIKCYGIFATHFHELTEMEEEVGTVGNLYVKAYCGGGKLTMLYDVCQGTCDESYGINVARFTKFPDHVVQKAENKLKQFEEVPGFDSKQELRSFVREYIRENPSI